jgi:hypothetical protein
VEQQMSRNPEDWRPPEPPSGNRPNRPTGGPGTTPRTPTPRSRWLPWLLVGLVVTALLVWQANPGTGTDRVKLEYSEFLELAQDGAIGKATYDQSNGKITGDFEDGRDQDGKSSFEAQGPLDALPDEDIALLREAGVEISSASSCGCRAARPGRWAR